MKPVWATSCALMLLIFLQACGSGGDRYVDLNTGMAFLLVKDPATGLMVDAETGKPLNIYVDTKTHDTVYGRTGKVINGHLRKTGQNGYVVDGAEADSERPLSGRSPGGAMHASIRY